MKFISFNAMTSAGLDRKVNEFLESHPDIEIVEIRFAADTNKSYVAILYQ